MAAILLDIGPGDECIIPSFTLVFTANAFVLRGARPVFAEIRPDTLNLDETKLRDLITPRTRAIVPVQYGGIGCEMDAIMEIAGTAGAVIEDNAHGLFGGYRCICALGGILVYQGRSGASAQGQDAAGTALASTGGRSRGGNHHLFHRAPRREAQGGGVAGESRRAG